MHPAGHHDVGKQKVVGFVFRKDPQSRCAVLRLERLIAEIRELPNDHPTKVGMSSTTSTVSPPPAGTLVSSTGASTALVRWLDRNR